MDQDQRESQRKKLIESLLQVLPEGVGVLEGDVTSLKIASVIVEYLIDRQKGTDRPRVERDDWGFFFWKILKPIHEFARTKEERDCMVVDFLEKVMIIATHPFRILLAKQEKNELEKVSEASSSAATTGTRP